MESATSCQLGISIVRETKDSESICCFTCVYLMFPKLLERHLDNLAYMHGMGPSI